MLNSAKCWAYQEGLKKHLVNEWKKDQNEDPTVWTIIDIKITYVEEDKTHKESRVFKKEVI